MRVGLLTKEWPPDVYGGAGVHVQQLAEQLQRLIEVEVQCFGAPRPDAHAYEVPESLRAANPALQTLAVDIEMVAGLGPVDLVHSHTWYANLAGQVAGRLQGIPHVLTAHSLEPLRPWKVEQLGGGYRLSSWVEESAYRGADRIIAVSAGMAADITAAYPFVDPAAISVVHNGIDTSVFRPDPDTSALAACGVSGSRPYALFVGRITPQKGLPHLLAAARHFDPGLDLVICASAPETPQMGADVERAIAELDRERGAGRVVWIREHVDRRTLIQLLTHALVFLCPSIYEPLGIVNLEAMACETAVVASAVGGIPEVVIDGDTGTLVAYTPDDPGAFERGIADAVNALAHDPQRAAAMGRAGRERAMAHFSWQAIAQQTVSVYEETLATF